VAALEEREVAWLSDEIYAGFIYEGEAVSPVAYSRNGLVISGLSKDLSMTGWRVGWVVGAQAVVARVVAAHQYIVTCASSISQAAAVAALGPHAQVERARMLEVFCRRRLLMGRLLEAIPGLKVIWPPGAFYYFVDISRFGTSFDVARRALTEYGVITIPGVAFGARGEGYLRLSYAASESDITAGVRALGASLTR
jgi:aspartate/methionine/tyrosine aminotransferase